MHHAAVIMMISDIATRDFCLKVTMSCCLRSHLRHFMTDVKISLRNTRGQSRKWSMIPFEDSSIPSNKILMVFSLFKDLSLGFINMSLLDVVSVMHEGDDGFSVWST